MTRTAVGIFCAALSLVLLFRAIWLSAGSGSTGLARCVWNPASPGALHVHRPAVRLDEVADDGEPEPEPAVLARVGRVGLVEALEDVGQRVGADADAGVPHHYPRARLRLLQPHLDAPPAGVNLTALERRLVTTCCKRAGSPMTGPAVWSSTESS
jgi:hypothetical protein